MTDKRIRIILDSKGAERDAKKLDREITGIGAAADSAQFKIKALAAAIAGALSVREIVNYSDAFISVQNQIRRTVDTTAQLTKTTADLLAVANETRSGLGATTELYTSLSVSTKSLGVSQKDVISVTKTINNLFLESGKTAAETEGAIRQLGQALESGSLRGDEFNSVAEGAPGILRAVEAQTGKTRAELRELAAQGKITAELLVNSLRAYGEEAQKAADKTKSTFAQSLIVAKNNATVFVGSLTAVQESTNLAGSAIVTISENLDTLANAAGVAAAVYVARLIPSLISSGTALTAQALAAIKSAASINSVAAAASTGTERVSAYTGAIIRTTTATQQATIATTLLGRAAGVASASMALLGGPAGIAFLVIAALTTYAMKTDDAASATDVLAESIEGLTRAQADNLELKTQDAIASEKQRVIELTKEIDRLTEAHERTGKTRGQASRSNSEAQARLADEIKRTKIELGLAAENAQKLEERLAKLGNVKTALAEDPDPFGLNGADPFASSLPEQSKKTKARPQKTKTLSPADNSGASLVADASATTAALQRELDLRSNISAIYRQNELNANASQFEQELAQQRINEQVRIAELAAFDAEDTARRNERYLEAMNNDALNRAQKDEIEREYTAQKELAAQIHQSKLSEIESAGAEDRARIAMMEKQARLDAWTGMASSGLALLQSFGSQSFKTQKRFAIADSLISIAAGVAKAMNNPYPANLGFAEHVALQGATLVSRIRSTNPSGGGGGSFATSAPTATASSVQSQAAATPTQVRIVIDNDIMGVAGKINDALKDLHKNGVEIAGARSR